MPTDTFYLVSEAEVFLFQSLFFTVTVQPFFSLLQLFDIKKMTQCSCCAVSFEMAQTPLNSSVRLLFKVQ